MPNSFTPYKYFFYIDNYIRIYTHNVWEIKTLVHYQQRFENHKIIYTYICILKIISPGVFKEWEKKYAAKIKNRKKATNSFYNMMKFVYILCHHNPNYTKFIKI